MKVLILTNMCKTPKQPTLGAFVKRQYHSIKAASLNNDDIEYYDIPEKYKLANSSLKRYLGFFSAFCKKYIFSRKKIDVLHVHFFFPTIVLAIAYKLLRNTNVKIVVTFHGNDVYHYSPFTWWYRLCHKFVSHSIFVSKSLKSRFYTSDIKSSVLSAGILSDFKPLKLEKKYDFIFVGHLDENKGAKRLLNLIENMPEHYQFAVVGKGPYESMFKANIANNLTYFDVCDPNKLNQLYNESKWLLSLSYNESFGLVLAEAMACGTPVIATETDGAKEQIISGENGFIIPQKDYSTEFLQDKIESNDHNLLSKSAIKMAERSKIQSVSLRVLEIYKEVINAK